MGILTKNKSFDQSVYRAVVRVAFALALAQSSSAFAADLSGVVVEAGPGFADDVMLAPPGEAKGPVVCAGDLAKRIRHLTSMTVLASGDWQKDDKGAQGCFLATDFTVTKVASGRDALVGILQRNGPGFKIVRKDGQSVPLTEVTDGLRKMEGQRVIVELRPAPGPTPRDATSKVVTFTTFP